jgi:hypothetical protein
MALPAEILLMVVKELLQGASFSLKIARLFDTILPVPPHTKYLHITAMIKQLRGLAWPYLNQHGGHFTATSLSELLRWAPVLGMGGLKLARWNGSPGFEHIARLTITPDQYDHFKRGCFSDVVPFKSNFPNLTHVDICLKYDDGAIRGEMLSGWMSAARRSS